MGNQRWHHLVGKRIGKTELIKSGIDDSLTEDRVFPFFVLDYLLSKTALNPDHLTQKKTFPRLDPAFKPCLPGPFHATAR